jgi:hypothetical protein
MAASQSISEKTKQASHKELDQDYMENASTPQSSIDNGFQ